MEKLQYFEKRLEEEKEKYVKFCQKNYDKDIYIYGAGRIAKPLYHLCKENNIKIKAFVVTSSEDNKRKECGIDIIGIDSIQDRKKEKAFILGVNTRLNEEIIATLISRGYSTFLEASEYLRYFGDYQHNFYVNPMMEITTKIGCAINCKFCPQDKLIANYYANGKARKELSYDDFKSCLEKIPTNVLIEFAGFTEPFFNRDCSRMILLAKEMGHRVNLFTTLRGMTKEDLEIIQHVEFEEFVLHVPDEEKYANIPIDANYLDMLDSVVSLKKSNGEDFVDYACSQGTVPQIIREHLNGNVRIFISLLDRAGNLEGEHLFSKHNIEGTISCETSLMMDHNVLLPDGRVVLCAQDYSLKHVLGNLLSESYDEIVYGEKYRDIIEHCCNKKSGDVLCRNCSLAKNEGEHNEALY